MQSENINEKKEMEEKQENERWQEMWTHIDERCVANGGLMGPICITHC